MRLLTRGPIVLIQVGCRALCVLRPWLPALMRMRLVVVCAWPGSRPKGHIPGLHALNPPRRIRLPGTEALAFSFGPSVSPPWFHTVGALATYAIVMGICCPDRFD